jgi:hypothetical protein
MKDTKFFNDRMEIRLTSEQKHLIKRIVKECSYEYENDTSNFIRAWIIRGIRFHKKQFRSNSRTNIFKRVRIK